MAWIERGGAIALSRQCELTGVARASVYRRTIEREQDEEDLLLLCRLIDEEYTRRPFYGCRRMVVCLRRLGHVVNRKRVQRLMRTMALAGMAPGRTRAASIRSTRCIRISAAWGGRGETKCGGSTDFTYVSTWQGFVYVAFVIDVFARCIVGWRVSSSMQTDFVLDALEQALYARQPQREDGLIHHSDRGPPNTYRFGTASALPRPASNLPLAVRETVMTMRWPRPLTACTKLN
jgi:putative transposase